RPVEFPRVDERVVSKRHRYGYSSTFGDDAIDDADFPDAGLLKYDVETGASQFRSFGKGSGAAEGVFIPRADDAAEDDGWVMAVVYVPERDGSDLVLLDAQDFTGEPVARVHLPQRVPFGFHGNWVPDGQ
ncbi:MAG TPA: carotenoid oxygenase family protein, partial [Acidimicrobiales bacterium]